MRKSTAGGWIGTIVLLVLAFAGELGFLDWIGPPIVAVLWAIGIFCFAVWSCHWVSERRPRMELAYFILIGAMVGGAGGWVAWRSQESRANRVKQQSETPPAGDSLTTVQRAVMQARANLTVPQESKHLDSALVQQIVDRELKKRESKRLSDIQLAEAAFSLAPEMRGLENQYKIRFDGLISQKMEWADQTRALTDLHHQENLEFRNKYLGKAVYLRDEMERRLYYTRSQEESQLIAFDGGIAGPTPISDAADYLEKLARRLAP